MSLRSYFQFYKPEMITVSLLAGVVVLVYLVILQPSGLTATSKEAGWREARSQMERLQKQKKVEKELAEFVGLLEDQQHYAEAINRPMIIARKYRLNVPSVIYQKEKLEQEFLKVSFSFSVTGTYESIRQFISEIESERHLYIIEDMNLGKSGKEGSSLELQLKVTTLLKQ